MTSSVNDAAAAMKARIRADLTAAMKAHRASETSLLRALLAILDNAEAVPVGEARDGHVARAPGDPAVEAPRLVLSEPEVQRLLQREAAEREAAAIELARLDQVEDAERLRWETAQIARYL